MLRGVQPKFFGNLDFELVVGPSGPTYEQTFPGVFESPRPPGAGVVPRPIIAAENGHLSKVIQTGIVGALRIDLGLLSIRVLCFSKSDKN